MRRYNRKTVFILAIMLFFFILFIWFQSGSTLIYVVNGGDAPFCFYLEEELKAVVPPGVTVKLKSDRGGKKTFAVSRTPGGMLLEEFESATGGKHLVYNIMGLAELNPKKPSKKGDSVLLFSGSVPGDVIEAFDLDGLHRIMMGSIPESKPGWRKIKPADAIRLAGEIKDESAREWLAAILKLVKRRPEWPDALRSLGMVGNGEDAELIARYLGFSDMDVSLAAIDALALMGDRGGTEKLTEFFRSDSDLITRKYILKKLQSVSVTRELKTFVIDELYRRQHLLTPELIELVCVKRIKEAIPALEKLLGRRLGKSGKLIKSEARKAIKILTGFSTGE